MTVESVTYIDDLDPNYPASADGMAEGDNHIRNIKSAIKATFPNIDGVCDATDTQLSDLDNKLALVGEVKFLCHSGLPSGGKWLVANGPVLSQATYSVLYAAVGGAWNTGSEGAGNFRGPDLRDRYVRGRGTTLSSFGYASQTLLTHGHSATGTGSTSVSVGYSGTLSLSGVTGGQSNTHAHQTTTLADNGTITGGLNPGSSQMQAAGDLGYTGSLANDQDHSHAVTVTGGNHYHNATATTTVSVTVTDYSGGSENRPNSIVLEPIFKALP